MYEKTPKELRIRQIVVKPATAGDATAADKAAQKKAADLAARIVKGEPFAKVAKEASDDAATRARGGELGWRHKGATAFETAVEEKLFAAKTGQVVGPVKIGTGWALLVSEGTREGDLTFDAVKQELAAEKVRQEKAMTLAKADADAAMAQAKTPAGAGKTLKELFPGKPESKGQDKDETKTAARTKSGDDDASDAPRPEETGLISRRAGRDGAVVEGIGTSNALSKAAFDLKTDAPLAGPFEIAGSYVVVRLKERKEPDMAEFEKKKLELRRDAELTKWIEVLTDWSHQRCVEAKAAKRIIINRDVLRYEDSAEPPPYEPCAPRRMFGG
jgi:parvulin-like peptidyl-prolyl isomerase